MKKIICIMICIMAGLHGMAQDMAKFRIIYDGEGVVSNRSLTVKKISWNLDIGEHSTYFYNATNRAMLQEIRNLHAEASFLDAFSIADQYPAQSRHPLEVFCDYPQKGQYTYETEYLKPLIYTDALPDIQWQLTDSTRQVCGYTCQQARGRVAGREWVVWFTADIPHSSGPWLLRGLPGLILEAEDTDRYFHFIAREMGDLEKPEPMYLISENEAISCTREQYREYRDLNRKDPNAYVYLLYGIKESSPIDYAERNKGIEWYFLDLE